MDDDAVRFEDLPDEIAIHVLSYLPWADVGAARLTCKSLHRAAWSSASFRALCRRHYPQCDSATVPADSNWHKRFVSLAHAKRLEDCGRFHLFIMLDDDEGVLRGGAQYVSFIRVSIDTFVLCLTWTSPRRQCLPSAAALWLRARRRGLSARVAGQGARAVGQVRVHGPDMGLAVRWVLVLPSA